MIGTLSFRNPIILQEIHIWYYSVTEKGISEFCHDGYNTVNLGLKKGYFEELKGKNWLILEKDNSIVGVRV